MKPIFVLTLLAVLAFAVAGCGSGKKTGSGQYTVTLHRNVASGPITVIGAATAAILNVKTGTHIRCKGWMGKDLRVPRLGSGLTLGESAMQPGSVTEPETEVMFLTHRENGSISVACQFVQPR